MADCRKGMKEFDFVEIFATCLQGFVRNMTMSAFVRTEQDHIEELQ